VSEESSKSVGHCRDLGCCDHDSGRDSCCDLDYDFDFDCYWGYAYWLMTTRNMMRWKRWRMRKKRKRRRPRYAR
jgi:hypothetical protein